VPATAEEPSDEELVARAADGDEPAFEALVGRYQHRAYRLACRLLGDESEAADALQEAFLSVYRSLRSFRGEARFSTWFFRVVTNAALMRRRAWRRRPTESLEVFLPSFDAEARAGLRGAGAAARRGSWVARPRPARAAGIERLPDLYREAFVLRDLEEMTTAEVAELLGVAADVVRQRVHRARLMLRGYLGDLAGAKR
jgi:RNA polymerase sigma-70 factor (ECF subfamily)